MSDILTKFNTTFNARHLKPSEIADSFVYNDDFEELLKNNHTVLLGARGSGKTTMLKMLTVPALYSWKGIRAKKILERLPFIAVYIPTDIHWNSQYTYYENQLQKFPLLQQKISEVSVTTNIFYSLCESFENILIYNNSIDKSQSNEIELSKALIQYWALPKIIPTLALIKEALLERISNLNSLVQKAIFNYKDEENINYDDYFFLEFQSSIRLAISLFERIYKLDSKWALCFDELELSPGWLKDKLLNSLRSTDQKFLFKLSTSPILKLSNELLASPGNDVKLIKMWPHQVNNKYQRFSERIVKATLKGIFGKEVDPTIIFGNSPLMDRKRNENEISEYDEGRETWLEIKTLAETDDSLKKLLLKHNIDPSNPIATQKRKLDTVLRKIKPTVFFRNAFSKYDEEKGYRIRRSRKVLPFYHGKEIIYTISDGNPRWLIGIIHEMVARNKKNRNNKKLLKIDESIQADVLLDISEQFFNILTTSPNAFIRMEKHKYQLSAILEKIGEFFFQKLALDDFLLDPFGTFYIEDTTDPNILKLLDFALYQGAIVFRNPSGSSFDFDLKGKNFRLSFLLHPKFRLPLRNYNAIALSRCLEGYINNPPVTKKIINKDHNQFKLYF